MSLDHRPVVWLFALVPGLVHAQDSRPDVRITTVPAVAPNREQLEQTITRLLLAARAF